MDLPRVVLSHPQPAEVMQPGQGPLADPAVHPQAAAVGRIAAGDPRTDPRRLSRRRCGSESNPRSPYSSRGRRRGRPGLPRTGGTASTACSSSLTSGQLAAVTVAANGIPLASVTTKCLLPFFRRSTGLGPVASPPPRARTCELSIAARVQSISPAYSSSARSISWSRCQTPAAVHSASRRQQVMPHPQPISWGRSSQSMPVLSTKRMPVRALRWLDRLAAGVAEATRLGLRQQGLDPFPQGVGQQRFGHGVASLKVMRAMAREPHA